MKRYLIYAQAIHSENWIGMWIMARDLYTAMRIFCKASVELKEFEYSFVSGGEV